MERDYCEGEILRLEKLVAHQVEVTCEVEAEVRRLKDESRTLREWKVLLISDRDRCRKALEDAIQLVKELIPYKSEYLVEKHDDKGELRKLEEALKESTT